MLRVYNPSTFQEFLRNFIKEVAFINFLDRKSKPELGNSSGNL